MDSRKKWLLAWQCAVMAGVAMAIFWAIWFLIAGRLPQIGDIEILWDTDRSVTVMTWPAFLLASHWWDAAGLALAAFVATGWTFWSIWAYDRVNGDFEEAWIWIHWLFSGLVVITGGLLAACHRYGYGLLLIVPIVVVSVSVIFVIGAVINALVVGKRWHLAFYHLSVLPIAGLTLGLVVGLTGLGLLWPPLIGLAGGLAANLVCLAIMATLWLAFHLAHLVGNPAAEIRNIKFALGWILARPYGLPPADGTWEVPSEDPQDPPGRRRGLRLARWLATPGTRVKLVSVDQEAFNNGPGTVIGRHHDLPGQVLVRFDSRQGWRHRLRYFPIGLPGVNRSELTLVDALPEERDQRFPDGFRPAWLADEQALRTSPDKLAEEDRRGGEDGN